MIFHLLHVTLCICFFWAETNGPKSRTVFSTAWFHKHLQPQIPEHTHITAEVSIFFSFLLPEIHILWDNFSCCWFSIKYFLYYDSLKHFLLYCWFSSSVKTAPISYMRGRLDWILCNWILCRQTGWKSLLLTIHISSLYDLLQSETWILNRNMSCLAWNMGTCTSLLLLQLYLLEFDFAVTTHRIDAPWLFLQ